MPNHMIYDHFPAKDGDGKEHQNDKDSFERFHGVMMYGLWGKLNYRSPASPFRGLSNNAAVSIVGEGGEGSPNTLHEIGKSVKVLRPSFGT